MNEAEGLRELCKIKECAQSVGIDHALFLGYGTLLGLVREGGFIGHDSDMDVCYMADWITLEDEQRLYKEYEAAGLFKSRRRRRVKDNGRALWYSLREKPKNDVDDKGVKCCNWFQYKWKGYMWHSKGPRWIQKIGRRRELDLDYPKAKAIAKGIPYECMRHLKSKKFYGEKFNIPYNYGMCLGQWYPNWKVPAGGSSKCSLIKVVYDWEDESKWKKILIENY